MKKLVNYLTNIALYLKVAPGRISLNTNSVPVRVTKNTATTGVFNIIRELGTEANSSLNACTGEDLAELKQWIEYALVYAVHTNTSQNINTVLNDLNSVLATRTYFLSQKLSIVDALMFYILQNVMENLSYLEKKKFLNVSRWYDNLQQNKSLRQSKSVVNFNTNYLSLL